MKKPLKHSQSRGESIPRYSPMHSKQSSGGEEYPQTNKHHTNKLDNLSLKKEPDKTSKNEKLKRTPMFTKGSNHQLIKNAISKVCLAGELNKKQREELFEIIGRIPNDINLIILFEDTMETRQDFKALYTYNEQEESVERVYGLKDSPNVLDESMVRNYFRYDSGAKEFKRLAGNKSFSIAIDGISLKPSMVKK